LIALLDGEEADGANEADRYVGAVLVAEALSDISMIRALIEAWIKAQAKAAK